MPGPPPGATVPVGSTAVVVFDVVLAVPGGELAAIGEVADVGDGALSENHGRFAGLGDSVAAVPSVFLERFCLAGPGDAAAGDSAAAAVASIFLARCCLAGPGDAAAGDSAAAAVASVFLPRFCLVGLGERAAGDSPAAAVAAGEVSFFVCLCLVTLGDVSGLAAGVGVCATNAVTENAVNTIIRRMGLFMPGRLTKPIAALQRQNV